MSASCSGAQNHAGSRRTSPSDPGIVVLGPRNLLPVLSAGQPTELSTAVSTAVGKSQRPGGCSHVGAHNHHGVFGEVSVVLLSGVGVCERPPAGVKSAEIGLGGAARYSPVAEKPWSERALPGVSCTGRSRIGTKTHQSGFREDDIFFATLGNQVVTRPVWASSAFDRA